MPKALGAVDGTEKQRAAMLLLGGPQTHTLLDGGARSGKSFVLLQAIAARALKAPGSRHAVMRFRFNHLLASVIEDTWPKVLDVCFPGVRQHVRSNKLAWFDEFPNGSQVWWGGLDDKDRVEKILGQEYATILLNECSQISYGAREVAVTRLAQKVEQLDGVELQPRMYYDANPPRKSHWLYRLFYEKKHPETREPVPNPENYAALTLNPEDNAENVSKTLLEELRAMTGARRRRFYEGRYGDAAPGQLFSPEWIDKWRIVGGELPDMQRIVVAVDPSGASDSGDSDGHDEVGIAVVGLGVDGNAYVLEDLTLAGGPGTWGKVATSAYDRHQADRVVGETNFGGGMVEHVIQAARPGTPYLAVTASRGKVVRAEPVAALYEDGKVRHVGRLDKLEDELEGFTDHGYVGDGSPNRADAVVWAVTELFPRLTRPTPRSQRAIEPGAALGYTRRDRARERRHGWVA